MARSLRLLRSSASCRDQWLCSISVSYMRDRRIRGEKKLMHLNATSITIIDQRGREGSDAGRTDKERER